MNRIDSLLLVLSDAGDITGPIRPYPLSFQKIRHLEVFCVHNSETDRLVALGKGSEAFSGTRFVFEGTEGVLAPFCHDNAETLRRLLPFTAPVRVLSRSRTFGLGDRLGIAGAGQIRNFREYDALPVLAQQSVREITLTGRSFEEVLDSATFAVFREGFRRGFGADGDHLKKPAEVEQALRIGYTMITLDCSEYIRGDVAGKSEAEVASLCPLSETLQTRYLGKTFRVGPHRLTFGPDSLRRCLLVYGQAVAFAARIFRDQLRSGKGSADFEISIDETATPTTPLQHYFVANELKEAGVKVQTLAPRFCGEFQKGIDYRGNLSEFDAELQVHAAIARHFGYKLSIHSGSDKFSIFSLVGQRTRGRFHVKTAGTNWLEAMRVVAITDPVLYRAVHRFALESFAEATKFYHVTTDLNKIPSLSTLKDADLPGLFDQDDARQLIHITYGFILQAKNADGSFRFRDALYRLWRTQEPLYFDRLYHHIGRHLRLLYSGLDMAERKKV